MDLPINPQTHDLLTRLLKEEENLFCKVASVSKDLGFDKLSLLVAKRAISYEPDNSSVFNIYPELKPIIQQILDISQESTSYEIQGYCSLILGDFPNAFVYLGKVLPEKMNTSDDFFWYSLGMCYQFFSLLPEACRCFNNALSNTRLLVSIPDMYKDIYFRFSLALRAGKDYDQCLSILYRIRDSPPPGVTTEDIMIQIAFTYQMKELYSKALEIVDSIIKQYPSLIELYYLQQQLRFQNKPNDVELHNEVDRYLLSKPNDRIIFMLSARIAVANNDLLTAFNKYSFLSLSYSTNPYYWVSLGYIYYLNKQLVDAMNAYQRSLLLKLDIPISWMNIGLIHEEQDQWDEAKTCYQIAESKCIDNNWFKTRIQMINQKNCIEMKIIDVLDYDLISTYPKKFAEEYIDSIPTLNLSAKIPNEKIDTQAFSTIPISIFK